MRDNQILLTFWTSRYLAAHLSIRVFRARMPLSGNRQHPRDRAEGITKGERGA